VLASFVSSKFSLTKNFTLGKNFHGSIQASPKPLTAFKIKEKSSSATRHKKSRNSMEHSDKKGQTSQREFSFQTAYFFYYTPNSQKKRVLDKQTALW